MITKPTIGGFGLNWQHCAHQTFFPSHSFEQWYQAIRRSWRFGQTRKVQVDVITTEGESRVLANLERKAKAADKMFDQLVELMNQALRIDNTYNFNHREEIPSWL
jgi:SNF2 family DNA or RNA helicase